MPAKSLFDEQYEVDMEKEYKIIKQYNLRSTFRLAYSEADNKWLQTKLLQLRDTEGWKGSVQDTKDQIRREYEKGTICLPWRWLKPNPLALSYLIHKEILPCSVTLRAYFS